MIVDIGGGRTEAAVISMYDIVVSESRARRPATGIDDAIVAYVKRRYNLIIGDRTAEEMKMSDRQRRAARATS